MNNADFIRVDEWATEVLAPNGKDVERIIYQDPADEYVRHDGKLVIIPFDEIFDRPAASVFNTFTIMKDSYTKQLPELTLYINYFLKYYDKNKELLMAYMMLKYQIDNKKNKIGKKAFIDMMYSVLFTKDMKQKISDMVEDNYYINLKSKKNVKYAETLEFTNEHAKIMMKISIAMKIMVPILFQYINRYNLLKEVSLFQYYERLFSMFSDDVDIMNKLWITVSAKIKRHHGENGVIWSQREIVGMDPLIYQNTLLKVNIISETMVKYRFFKNIVSFNSVVLDKQLMYFTITQYAHTRIELTTTKDSEGLSGLDMLEMTTAKIDESLVILSNVNIKETIKSLKRRFNVVLDKDEIAYYERNLVIDKFQVHLVGYFFAKYFGGYRDLNLLTRRQYIKIVLILKYRLLYQGFIYLPFILTGNIDKLVKRTIRNQKFLDKVKHSSVFAELENVKFDALAELDKKDYVFNPLSVLLNSQFTLVDYDRPERFGALIEIHTPDILSDEFLSFLNQI